ncbi:alpha/beta hydrolase fold-domain-containing protein [Xylariales sp. PMI_506]|nr:alpha/beta hydrolase fold-domain-containing protein [Xylariales sp. PMI_506]
MASQTSATGKDVAAAAVCTERRDLSDLSFTQRLLFGLRCALHRNFFDTLIYVTSVLHPIDSRRIVEKSWKSHPHLKHRIIPPLKRCDVPPPILLDIHGGGFIMGKPFHDDEPNLNLSSSLNCLIISLNYSKAPAVQFPTPINELIDTVLDILADDSLDFDRSRVALGGYSAGANYSLSVAQSPKLQGKIHGIIAWYPCTDVTIRKEAKALSRPYTKPGEVDSLMAGYEMFMQAYIPKNSISDPGVSVTFAERETLPKDLLIIGAEMDILCKEAAVMAGKYADIDLASSWDTNSDKRKFGFQAEGIRWILARNARHGFTHALANLGEKGRIQREIASKTHEEVCQWLLEGCFLPKGE